ncbi:MAG: AAA family ATPase [Candidatus Poseidoniales archaeon]
MEFTTEQKKLINMVRDCFGTENIKRKDVKKIAEDLGMEPPYWFFSKFATQVKRGSWSIPDDNSIKMAPAEIIPIRNEENVVPTKFDPNTVSEFEYAQVPDKDSLYIPFGEFKDVESIVRSQQFFPIFISGLSGNGKTFMVEQACARAKRPMVRVQMSRETDEDDLIGGFRLVNGETKFMKGPVLRAMELGAVLLIDEADRADPGKVMCLQGVLEGKPYYAKKTGEVVKPAPGFNVIVTANTKGKGSDDGRYISATILDEAWLERFPITVEQNFPSEAIEKRILKMYDLEEDFINHLVMWAAVIRKTFFEGAIDEIISTRRLVHIAKTFKIFNDRERAISLCVNRYDEETKTAFLDLYAKVDPTIAPEDTLDSETLPNPLREGLESEQDDQEVSF